MPLDAIFLSALTDELREALIGAKIDKIQMPERDMLLFSLRGRGENLRLLIAAGTGNARVHLTKSGFENPAQPPMFCMLLRKHLIGARIVSLTQPVGERLLIPSCMLRYGEEVFLDDMTVTALSRSLGVPIRVVGPRGEDLCAAIFENGKENEYV